MKVRPSSAGWVSRSLVADVLLAVTRQRERLQGIWECTVIEGVMTLMVMMCVSGNLMMVIVVEKRSVNREKIVMRSRRERKKTWKWLFKIP